MNEQFTGLEQLEGRLIHDNFWGEGGGLTL